MAATKEYLPLTFELESLSGIIQFGGGILDGESIGGFGSFELDGNADLTFEGEHWEKAPPQFVFFPNQ